MYWWLLYAPMTAGAVVIATYGREGPRSEDTLGAALLLSGLWVIWNLSHWLIHRPYNQFFPVLDGASCMALAWTWRRRLRPWKVGLIGLFLADCAVHAVYFYRGSHSHAARYNYDLIQNILYVGQLLCVSSVGIRLLLSRTPARRLNP